MKLVIVTGMSGAGKTVALKMLEDTGYYCVDNLPIPLMEKFAQLVLDSRGPGSCTALGIDIRSGEELSMLSGILDSWKAESVPCEILFLDASDQVLIKRYKETRRSHPLSGSGRVDQGIRRERDKLRQELEKIFMEDQNYDNLFVTVLSFGFKYGIPADADLVFDVRFLPNPFYVEELRQRTGEERDVQDYVMQGGTGAKFLQKLFDMVDFLIPNYILEGKNQLVIAVGCTGGKHRSVTIANALYSHLEGQRKVGVKIEHRDIENDSKRKK